MNKKKKERESEKKAENSIYTDICDAIHFFFFLLVSDAAKHLYNGLK